MPVPFTGAAPTRSRRPPCPAPTAWPPNGGPPGSDLAFLQEQLLDRYGVEHGMLHLLSPTGMDQRNQEFGAAICRAVNEWQVAPSGPAAIPACTPPSLSRARTPQAAVAEIEHWAGHPGFAQVAMVSHTIEPLGRRRYWPIYEAAAAHGLPIGLHTSGFNGHAVTPAGWPSFYVEEQHEVAISQQAVAVSLVTEGVFARIPALSVVIVEAGFAWVPSVAWRLDRAWERGCATRSPISSARPPSTCASTSGSPPSPSTSRSAPSDLRAILDWIGWDRILFATDYPHWDMDNPEFAFKLRMYPDEQRMIYGDNARRVYGLA